MFLNWEELGKVVIVCVYIYIILYYMNLRHWLSTCHCSLYIMCNTCLISITYMNCICWLNMCSWSCILCYACLVLIAKNDKTCNLFTSHLNWVNYESQPKFGNSIVVLRFNFVLVSLCLMQEERSLDNEYLGFLDARFILTPELWND